MARADVSFEPFKTFSPLMNRSARTLEFPDNEASDAAIKCNIFSNFIKNRFLSELLPRHGWDWMFPSSQSTSRNNDRTDVPHRAT